MLRSEIEAGQEYALREGKSSDTSLQRVKIIQHVRGKKWKAEWIDPNPGLVEYVDSRNLIVLWKERKAYFQDEEKGRDLRFDNERNGYSEKSPLANALYEVFESVPQLSNIDVNCSLNLKAPKVSISPTVIMRGFT